MVISRENFADLIGEDLSGVTFVRDYLQLQFNPPPLLNAYAPVHVRSGESFSRFGEEHFANLLIAQIDKVVRDVNVALGDALTIRFEDNSEIAISLRLEDMVEGEALVFHGRHNRFVVVTVDDV